jgi:hypothetical protein
MKEYRCLKCNKLLFKHSENYEIAQGQIEIETQHNCRSEDKSKVKDVKVFS